MRTLPILVLSLLTCTQTISFAQSQKGKGFPERGENIDILPGFQKPPKGYGNVPFYWWSGDHLTKERLKEQLDTLATSATDGFAISYIHTDPKTDSIFNKNGHGLYGRTEPGEPAVFSDEWWDIWKWFSKECAVRGLGAGLDDYTVGWIGNGYYPDEVDTCQTFQNYQGGLDIQVIPVKSDELFQYKVPENFLTAVAWPGQINLESHIKNGNIRWKAPSVKGTKVYVITTKKGYILHPEYGKALVNSYFNRFENKMTAEEREGMNYFFQDELSYPIKMTSWSTDFQEEFKRRKGYDILPFLPALKEYIGPVTPKIRLDYAEVLMDLSEERYYKPIYDWHAKRELIYGSDNLGRGLNPLAYVDYFRANSWYTAPGNDAPSRGSSFIQTKVSSSIAHLYNRPRTWLEAFHSMGWGSSGEWLTQQIDHHFMAGGNLVCMHGLYYSTHGGWWEWAPPCFHFRMPYWPHMKTWLQYTERMSYLLSQGDHVCDIALMYPTESMQAYPEATTHATFNLATRLSDAGLDYDFLDFRSLRDADLKDKALHITNEQYKVLIIAGMQAMHYSSLLKLRDFYRSGGIVLATGDLPKASSREGEQDTEVDAILKEVFGLTAAEAEVGKVGQKQTNASKGIGWYIADGSIEEQIPKLITPDFIPNTKGGKVLHRKAGQRDIYMVMNVEKGSECFFRSKGKVELWNANDGTIQPYPIVRQDEKGTWLKLNKEYTNSYLVVFSPGEPLISNVSEEKKTPTFQLQYDGEWEVELLPTLNNKWGDFRLPTSDEYIAAEARFFRFIPEDKAPTNWMAKDFQDNTWEEGIYGYGVIAETRSDSMPEWTTFPFSWQYGVWDNPGSQGYHGLKSKVSDGFFILDKGGKQLFRTYVHAPQNGSYRIEQTQTQADEILIDNKKVETEVYLTKGWHALQVAYENTTKTEYKSKTGAFRDFRSRGAVVLVPTQSVIPEKPSIYADQVAMRWTKADHLPYDLYQGKYQTWNYRFRAVPGLEEMDFAIRGDKLKVWVDGQSLPDSTIQAVENLPDGIKRYKVVLPHKEKRIQNIAFSIVPQIGYSGTAAIAEPIKLKVGKGLLQAGDWSKSGALRCYSGGMIYKKTFTLSKADVDKAIELDLGNVIATCEVKINGASAGILMSPPYKVDISSWVQSGVNEIEVLVYSTLANHYQTQPTPYRGNPQAGLIGPVILLFFNK